jgi:hypothetical protein
VVGAAVDVAGVVGVVVGFVIGAATVLGTAVGASPVAGAVVGFAAGIGVAVVALVGATSAAGVGFFPLQAARTDAANSNTIMQAVGCRLSFSLIQTWRHCQPPAPAP